MSGGKFRELSYEQLLREMQKRREKNGRNRSKKTLR